MPATLTIRDQTATGATLHEQSLDFLTERITVRELIRSRVYQEVKDHNVRTAQAAQHPATFRGLVQPTEEERVLNAPRSGPRGAPSRREIDWKRQFDVALEAFERSGFMILVDERQVRRLDEEIVIRTGTQVAFVKLVPLVGG